MKLGKLLEQGQKRLEQENIIEAVLESRLLLEYILKCDRTYIILNKEVNIKYKLISKYLKVIDERVSGKPIQHIIGQWEFMGLTFIVNQHTLIPRSETEILVSLALDILKKEDVVLDLGTGNGCMPISLCYYNKEIKCMGVDYSIDALQVAKENGMAHHMDDRVSWIYSNLFDAIDRNNRYNMIISNPPYIETKVIDTLESKVKDYEPRMALDGGEDGLDYYRSISKDARNFLVEEGYIIYEVGHNQADRVMDILANNHFKNVSYRKDYNGIKRVVYGKK